MINEANWDRIARVVLGVAMAAIGFGLVGGTIGTVIGVIAAVPLLTGAIGWCPIYTLLKFRTNKPLGQ